MAAIILRIVIWLSWVSFILLNIFAAKYLPHHEDTGGPSPIAHGLAMPGVLVILSILMAGGLRWWISRIRTLSLKLLPIWLGLFSSYLTQCFGFFLEPNHLLLFQILSDLILLAYYPLFLTDKWIHKPIAPPPLPKEP